jgi:8-oxo-dGTP pyrophosphatase MutT (NUDIX family)
MAINVLPELLAKSKIFQFNSIPSEMKQFYKAAGILPFAKKENETYFLLGNIFSDHRSILNVKGQEVRNNSTRWSEFGGKVERFDESSVLTAIREFNEETNYYFESHINAHNLLKYHIFKFASQF